MMLEFDCGGIPVCQPGTKRLIGFLTDRDIVIRSLARGMDPMQMTAQDVMTTDLHTVRPSDSVDTCIQTMQKYKVRRVPVTNDQGEIVGIVSQADLVRRAAMEQPELAEEVEEMLELVSEPKAAI